MYFIKSMLICTTGYYTGLICGLYIDYKINKYITHKGISNSYYCALLGTGITYLLFIRNSS